MSWLYLLFASLNLAAQTYPTRLGDLDGDGFPTAHDLAAIASHISGAQRLSNEMAVFADVNQDGAVNDLDADLMASAILELVELPELPLTRLLESSPSDGAQNVAVTRETILHFSQPLSAATLVTPTGFYAEFGGQRLITRAELFPDRRTLALFYTFPLPGSARVRVTFNGNLFRDFAGRPLDADGDGQPGGIARIEFDTLSQTPFPGTIVCGRVFASQLATNAPGGTNLSLNTPLRGVTVTADGLEQQVRAVTDQFGNFRLTNAPGGRFFVHVDGRTLTNLAEAIRWPDLRYYPFVGKEWESIPGGETNIGEIFLPLITAGTLQSVSFTNDTLITFPTNVLAGHPELEGVTVTVPPGALFSDSGARGGKVGIAPVPPDRLPGALPLGLSFPLVITLQTDGPSNFGQPVPVCFPNLTNAVTGQAPLPPGAKSALWSFNHDTGQWEIVGPMTVSDDGRLICSDPGVGILAPGWHGSNPGSPGCCVSTNPLPPDPEPPEDERDGKKRKKKPPESTVSDPIQLFSGEFKETVEDLRIPGVGFDFVWTRTYRSKSAAGPAFQFVKSFAGSAWINDSLPIPSSPLGHGWDHSYNISVTPSGRGIEVRNGTGRNDIFRPTSEWITAAAGFFRKYFRFGGFSRIVNEVKVFGFPQCFTTTLDDGMKYTYHPCDGSPKAGSISTITDRNGNTMSFEYDGAGRLTKIVDTLNRLITISYTPSGLISTVTDFAGRSVRYAYYQGNEPGGDFGDLKSVTTPAVTGTPNGNDFPNGKTTTYTYSKRFADQRLNHNLLTVTDGRGSNYLVNIYSSTTNPDDPNFDRVVRQVWGGDPVQFTYVPQSASPANNGATMRTIVNDRMGHVKEFFYDAANRLVMLREFTGLAIPGLPATEFANRPAGKLRSDDPVYFETRHVYNADNQVTRTAHPNGNVTEYIYQADIEPNASPTTRQNLRAVRRLPESHSPTGDQPFISEQFEYLPDFNFVTRHVDARGHETINQYDEKGNRTNVIHRISGITEQFTYNARGQMTRHIFPDNGSGIRREDAMNYHEFGPERGYLSSRIVDIGRLGLSATFNYDLVGNVTNILDSRVGETQLIVNQLNQTVRELSRHVSPTTSPLRYRKDFSFDAADNLIRVETENRSETGALQPNASFTTTFEYEALDRLTRRTDEVSETNSIVTEYAYDKNRNLTLSRSGEATSGGQPANAVEVQYDERDLPFRSIRAPGDADQSTTQFDYDGNGNRVRQWQGLESQPRVTGFAYDGFDRMVAATNAMGSVSRTFYDPNGNTVRTLVSGELLDVPGSTGNRRLTEANFTYDPLNRRTNATVAFFDTATGLPVGDGLSTTRTIYTDASQVQAVINDNGHGITNRYDSANRLSQTTDAKGNTVQIALDDNGNLLRKTETEKPSSGGSDVIFVTTFAYDGLDRLIQTVDSAGNTNRIAYDSRGNAVQRIDPKGNIARSVYDGLSRLTATTRVLTDTGDGSGNVTGGITTRQAWDDSSRLTARIDPNGNPTRYQYDALNRLRVTLYADGTGVTNSLDPHDNLIITADANGNIVTNIFDLANRLARREVRPGAGVSPATTFETFRYDGLSRLVEASNNVSIITRTYDSLSRVTSETQNGATVATAFDGVGNALRLSYPGGRVLTNRFDDLERKTEITDDTGSIILYDYIGPGRIRRRHYGDETTGLYAYDGIAGVPNPTGDYGVRRLVRSTHTSTASGSVIDDRAYAWDGVGNKTLRRDLRASGPQLEQNFHYDSAYRMVQSARAPPATPAQTIDYALDSAGNRLSVTGGANPGAYAQGDTQPEPADRQLNQYTTTAFDTRANDANGNLMAVNSGQSTERRFAYDYRNRLVAFTNLATGLRAAYTYDALNRRIAKTVTAGATQTTRFLYDGHREIEERDGSGAVLATYVHGVQLDELVQMRRAGQDFYYHADDLLNVTAVTSGGNVAERYDYADFGAVSVTSAEGTPRPTSQIANPWLMTGRRLDPETGLYYFRSRYYDPAAGRFTSRDTAGMWYDAGNLGNGYAFVANNPWSYVDPFGFGKDKTEAEPDKPWWEDALGVVDYIGSTGGEFLTGVGIGAIEAGIGIPAFAGALWENPWGTIGSIPGGLSSAVQQIGADVSSGNWRQIGHGLFNAAGFGFGGRALLTPLKGGLPGFGAFLRSESGAGYFPGLSRANTSMRGNQLMIHPFSEGATHITTSARLAAHADSPTYGGQSGLFVAPTRQIDSLLASGASRAQIEVSLGLDQGALSRGTLMRIDVADPFARNLSLPTSGNMFFRPGTGLTTGGISEGVITGPLKTDPGVLLRPIP